MNSNDLTTEQLSIIGSFYDHMSHILTSLKKIFNLFQRLVIYKERYLQYDQIILSLTNSIEHIRNFIAKMPAPKDQDEQKTFKRTLMRILEVTQFHKHKYEEYGVCIDLICLIKQSQSSLIAKQSQKDLKNCLFCFLKIVTKHLNRLRPKNQEQVIEIDQRERKNSDDLNIGKKPRGLRRQFSIQKDTSQIDNIIGGFNSYLKVLSNIQIDTNAFRNSFFQAKGLQNTVFYSNYLKRNSQSISSILAYSRQFKQYLKRRQQRNLNISRRNKFFDKSLQNRLNAGVVNLSIIGDQKQLNFQINQDQNGKGKNMSSENQEKMKLIQEYRRKRTYQMKTLVFTGDKLEVVNKKAVTRKGDNCKINKNELVFIPQNKNIRVTTVFFRKDKKRSCQVIRKGLKDVKKALLNSFHSLNNSYYKTK